MVVDVGLHLLTVPVRNSFAGTANGHIEVIPWGMCDKILLDRDPAAASRASWAQVPVIIVSQYFYRNIPQDYVVR